MYKPDKINDIWENLSKRFPELTVVRSSKTFIDIMASGVNKAKAVEYLCQKWNIEVEEVIAFGKLHVPRFGGRRASLQNERRPNQQI